MSYLHLPRLIFSGDFISDVSTVNNDPQHYNNATFIPSFQEFGQGGTNGWWNPEGGATFNLQDCTICGITYKDGTSQINNKLVGMFVKGPEGSSSGKMVDLDPQQQMVSELWAVRLRILTKQDVLLLEGDLEVTAFRDLQLRQHDGMQINGQPLGASWTSVLKNISWSKEVENYRFFQELKSETQDNRLAVNLNGFGYYYSHAKDGRFSLGRMLGAIGPWYRNEPINFTAERRLYATKQYGDSNRPSTYFNFSNFRYDEVQSRLSLDLGSSFPVSDSLGTIAFNSSLILGISKKPLDNLPSLDVYPIRDNEFIEIGTVAYSKGDWLMKSAGIIDIEGVANDLKDNQLILLIKSKDGTYNLMAREAISGLNVQADNMVLRLDNGQRENINFFARQWGKPLKSARITVQRAKPTKPSPGPICTIPGNNYPVNGITIDGSTVIISDGVGSLTINGNEIDAPRGYLDGQVYFLSYQLEDESQENAGYVAMISILLKPYSPIPDQPKWSDIQETMQQFSNLYPIMSKYLVDLGDRDAVLEKKEILLFAFSQDIDSPIYMPVTRDLSESKRLTILKWLESNGIHDSEEQLLVTTEEGVKKLDKTVHDLDIEGDGKPSDFHQKIITTMRMKMGENLPYLKMDHTKF